jgi:hypothetical protein
LTGQPKIRTSGAIFAPKLRIAFPDARPTGGAAHAFAQAWLWWRDIPSAAARVRLW